MHVDASAALGIAQKRRAAQTTPPSNKCLMAAESSSERALQISKVDGSKNPADVQTRHVSREISERHMAAIGCEFREGRASAAAQLHSVKKQAKQLRNQWKALKERE